MGIMILKKRKEGKIQKKKKRMEVINKKRLGGKIDAKWYWEEKK